MRAALSRTALPLLLAAAFACFAVSVDLHNSEPQAAALVLIVGGFMLGAIWPSGAWRWALVLGFSIVIGDPIGVALGANPPWPERGFNPGGVVALIPAFLGTYAGVWVRRALGVAARSV